MLYLFFSCLFWTSSTTYFPLLVAVEMLTPILVFLFTVSKKLARLVLAMQVDRVLVYYILTIINFVY